MGAGVVEAFLQACYQRSIISTHHKTDTVATQCNARIPDQVNWMCDVGCVCVFLIYIQTILTRAKAFVEKVCAGSTSTSLVTLLVGIRVGFLDNQCGEV